MADVKRDPRRRRAAVAVLAALVVACAALAFTKPPMAQVERSISAELIEGAGNSYNLTGHNYLIFNIARGRNIKSAATDTYIGIAGSVLPMNSGAAKPIANVLFWIPPLLGGTRITVALTMVSVFAGVIASVFLALGKISKFPPLSAACRAYIFFFRGTPLLMQLFFIYYALPDIIPSLTINNKFLAAFIAFALNSAAYCAEIIRAAIQSIDKGQSEASRALGLSGAQTMRLVIIPQSVRRLIPPVANEFIMVLKDASLVSIIALTDLTQMTRSISSSAGNALVYVPAMVIYLVITAFFSFVFNKLETRFSVYQ
ncbi:MAG: amino acid ABC transporter permease [Oscillospiraceae bacterium]|jgi:polar amino acid transport system permease protein|nr:amino acid ABC transporter permease [Oscillospiraceae bacterium]